MSMAPATREFPSLKTQVWIQQIQSSRKSQGMLSQKSKELHSHGEGPRGNKFSMCKRRITRSDPGQKPDEIGNINQESVNLGLINVESSSSTFNKIPIWQILEVLSILILLALVYRWVKKWWKKKQFLKKGKQQMRLARMLELQGNHRPSAPQAERPRIPLALEMQPPRAEPAVAEVHEEHDFDRYR